MEGRPQKNLVLILAREFASKLATATFLIDHEGRLVYFNEPAERILGRSFAEAGELNSTEWRSLFQAEELDGTPLPVESMPGGIALLERRPAHHSFRIRGLDGQTREISSTALPLLASPTELVGVMVVFWELGKR
jgi:PAS domain-containing protein